MGVLSALRESVVLPIRERVARWTGNHELAEQIRQERATVAYLQETLANLEARLQDPYWVRLTTQAEHEFSRDGLRLVTEICRVMTIKSPMLKRGLALRTAYVWGQGVSITARDVQVNQVIQRFLSDPGNRRIFSGDQAHEQLERSLFTDGNVFLALFTSPRNGRVQVRRLPWDEVVEVITNPDDRSDPWYYKRDWWEDRIDPLTGARVTERRIAFYPALGYNPKSKPKTLRDVNGDTGPVLWDAPVYHVKVGGDADWKWGLPDAYAAVDWARAYREFLEDWARLVKALTRFAWRVTTKGNKQALAKARLAAPPTRDPLTGDAQHAGATAIMPQDMTLEAVPKSGATIDSESGRPLAAMVASALDIPVTMLLGDPGTTGARATAETLDTPTERSMEMRRQVWTTAFQAIFEHVIREAVRAPEGGLNGRIEVDPYTGRETVTLAGGADATVDISWPDLDDIDVASTVDAIVRADSTGHLPPLVVARLLLETLGVRDVDTILEQMTDEDGNFVAPQVTAGQVAVDRFRRGQDPAAAFGGGTASGDGEDEGRGEREPARTGGVRGDNP